ncbi:EAL domain-containing protein [Thiomicrorhabdus indica]|uniref:bifunctional diguanylate cyclase/phosphodiesterase n=1 Tax=Thiomicrorhabdus indica TaxID=2267253 RepID=UPI00102E0694|nr:EAL domain-containing protein [Thiomicrorhabdus indica]
MISRSSKYRFTPSALLYKHISILISVSLGLLLIIYWVAAYNQFNSSLNHNFQKNLKDVTNYYSFALRQKSQYLEGALFLLQENSSLQKAFLNKDRKKLFALSDPVFQQALLPNQITHFYFTDLDRVNYLRVHAPEHYGDQINRITMLKAEQTKQVETGVELGVMGTLTLRAVSPWYDQSGRQIGYLELGIDLDHIVESLAEHHMSPMFIGLHKKYISQGNWATGDSVFKHRLPWSSFDNRLVTSNHSINQESLLEFFSTEPEAFKTSKISPWQSLPLTEIGGRTVGELYFSLDLGDWIKSFWRDLLVSSAFFIVIAIFLVLGVRYYGHRIQKAEEKAQSTLQELSFIASYDQLTGLPNRDLFFIELEQHIKEAEAFGHSLAVCFIDIDDFKKINDTLGHSFGDQLLKTVASHLQKQIRNTDILCRMGGDEFVLLIPQSNMELLGQLMPSLTLSETVIDVGSRQTYLSTSIGISHYPEDGLTSEKLLQHADMAMYHAKNQGKSCYRFFESSMNDALHRWSFIENGLRQAIVNNELQLNYQAQFDLLSKEFIGFEALVRWIKPDGTVISPAEFIPIAEKSRLIFELDDWVINEACRQYQAWAYEGFDCSIDVNLSGRYLDEMETRQTILEKMQEYQIPYGKIGIEITENTLIQANDVQIHQLQMLSEKGVKLSLDDFGTGYSSLSYLKNFPVSVLKIDQSFVRDAPEDKNDYSLMQAIVAMGHSLGLKVIAEGIETKAHEKVAKEVGCDRVQGYLYHKPMPASHLDLQQFCCLHKHATND